MADDSSRSVLYYVSDEASRYRGTKNAFLSRLAPGSSSQPVPHVYETIRVLADSTADFGTSVYFTVPHRSVLLKGQTLSFILPQVSVYSSSTGDYIPFRWPNAPACAIVEFVEVYIDSILVDRITGEHLYIKIETEYPDESKYNAVRSNIGEDNSTGLNLTTMYSKAQTDSDTSLRTKGSKRIYLPLDFWFKDPGCEFPNTGNIKFRVKFRQLNDIMYVSGGVTSDTIISTTFGTHVIPTLSDVEILLESVWVPDATAFEIINKDRESPLRLHYVNTLKTKVSGGFITARTEYIPKPIRKLTWVLQNESVLRNMGNDYFRYTDTDGYNLMLTAKLYAGTSCIQESMSSEHYNSYIPTIYGLRVPASGIYMKYLSDIPVDVGNSGTISRSLGIEMTTQTGVGDLSTRIFVDTYVHYTVKDSVFSFDALI